MVETVDTPDAEKAAFELLYRNCSGDLENYKAKAYGAARGVAQTADACQAVARTQGTGEVQQSSIKPGLVLCVLTTDNQIGWARVTKVSCPCKETIDNNIPTIELTITVWRK